VTVKSCLPKYYVAASGRVHIVAKFYMNTPQRPSEIHTL